MYSSPNIIKLIKTKTLRKPVISPVERGRGAHLDKIPRLNWPVSQCLVVGPYPGLRRAGREKNSLAAVEAVGWSQN
jgi:hypothetical protein